MVVEIRSPVNGFSENSDYSPFVEFTTDRNTTSYEIFQKFIIDVRSDSIYSHIDWKGLSEQEKEKWTADYQQTYEASTYLLLSYGSSNMLKALEYSTAGLNKFPDQPSLLAARDKATEELFSAGVNMVMGGNEDGAMALAGRILQIDKQSAPAWILISVTTQKRGDMQKALAAAQQAVSFAPDNPDAHFNLGILLLRVGQFEQSIAEYKRALQLAEDSSNWVKIKMLNSLASAYATAGRFSEAIAISEKALDLAISDNLKNSEMDIRMHLTLYKQGRAN